MVCLQCTVSQVPWSCHYHMAQAEGSLEASDLSFSLLYSQLSNSWLSSIMRLNSWWLVSVYLDFRMQTMSFLYGTYFSSLSSSNCSLYP